MQDTEIDVSPLLASPGFDPWNCCNSVASLGQNAGKRTWQASRSFAPALVLSEGQKEAFREFVRDSGGWDEEETAAFSDAELTALGVQWIAGDIREGFGDGVSNDPAEWDWAEYQKESEAGHCPSSLYLHDGKLFWSCAQ